MVRIHRAAVFALILALAGCPSSKPATSTTPTPVTPPTTTGNAMPEPPVKAPEPGPQVPVEYHKLDNGLKVVLSPDHTAPIVTVMIYYHIGFRIEPANRTGFAHLFEHLMFQGSENLGKMEFIKLVQQNGGVVNGSTRFDYTNYMEVGPSNTLRPLLWAEADRMRGLAITQENLDNQRSVVKNEVRVNVINAPYGGFPWIDLPMTANTNPHNAHNFYGDMKDLDAATLDDAKAFFHTYYSPNNAALVITGDFEPADALAMVQQYFGSIPSAPQPERPDVSEPKQTAERHGSRVDPLAKRPALAIAYHMPPRNTPEHAAMVLIREILSEGPDSILYQKLVRDQGLTGNISSSINLLGNAFDYEGPMLYSIWLFHDQKVSTDAVVHAIDQAVERLRTTPVDADTLARAKVKWRSWFYDVLDGSYGIQRAGLLAAFALFDDDPGRINKLQSEEMAVTPALIQKTAETYLRPQNRTIYTIEVPKAEK